MRGGACFFLPRVPRGDHEKTQCTCWLQACSLPPCCHHRGGPCRADGMRRRWRQRRWRVARRHGRGPFGSVRCGGHGALVRQHQEVAGRWRARRGQCGGRCSGCCGPFGQAHRAARHRLAQQLQAVVPPRCRAEDLHRPRRRRDRSAQAGRRHRGGRAQPQLCQGPHHAAQGVEPRRGDRAHSHAADAGRLRAAAAERRPDRQGQVPAAHGVGRQDPVLRRGILPARRSGAQPVLLGRHRHLQGGAFDARRREQRKRCPTARSCRR